MSAYKNTTQYAEKHPIMIGVFAVLATVLLGSSIAFGTGMTTPSQALAFVVPPVVVPVVAPPPVIPPVPVVVPITPIVPVVPVTPVTVPSAPASTDSSQNTNSSNSGSNSGTTASTPAPSTAPSDGTTNVTVHADPTPAPSTPAAVPVTPVTPEVPTTVVVHGNTDSPDNTKTTGSLLTTTDTGTTNVTVVGSKPDHSKDLPSTNNSDPVEVTVTAPTKGNNNLPPCCTNQSTPDSVTTPATTVVTVTGQPNKGNNDLPPCCTDVTTPTPIVTPPGNNNLPPCCTDITPSVPVVPVVPVTPVVPVVPTPPLCEYLKADKTEIQPGDTVTLSWKTVHATSISIDQGVGPVTPVAQGSTTVRPTKDTTYTATVNGTSGTVTCQASVVIKTTPPPTPECVALTADKTEINPGEAVTLAWQTKNATTVTINGDAVTPLNQGSKVVNPATDTTYVEKVNGSITNSNCQVTVKVKPPVVTSSPECISLNADKSVINPGESVTLTWTTQNASAVSIDNNIGNVTPVDHGSITVTPPSDSVTYTATVPNAPANGACSVTITTQHPGGGGGGGGGGGSGGHGGGGHDVSGQIIQGAPAAAYVYLSQIPYTGLDLGPVGTIIYWTFLVLWCVAAAYLILFKLVPFFAVKMHLFGAGVDQVLNHSAAHGAVASAGAHAAGVAHLAAAHAPAAHGPTVAHAPAHGPAHPPASAHHAAPAMAAAAPAAAARAFAPQGETLTIDDIVKGLSRESGATWQVGNFHQEDAIPAAHAPAPAHEHAAPAAHAPAPMTNRPAPVAAPLSADVRDFIAALLNDERDTVFGTIRHIIREGGDAEAFLSQVVCALDDAYRARVEGSNVHPEIAEITRGCATNFLERLVAALTNAVDSSYSVGVTGAKLALTRALAIIEG